MELGRLNKFVYQLKAQCLKSESPINFILQLNDKIKSFFGCQKVTFVPVDSELLKIVVNLDALKKDNDSKVKKYIHHLEYLDEEE